MTYNDAAVHPLESTFTAPHDVAPHPEWWHAPDNDSTECEIADLIAGLVRGIQPRYVVETGTAYGFTTAKIADALDRNGHGQVDSLEVDPERVAHATARVAHWIGKGIACIIRQSSLEFAPLMRIDFALFDSLYELRAQEFIRYYELGALAPGTIVAFHDWTSGIRGHYMDVQAEVESLRGAGLLTPVYIPSPRGLVIAEVR